MLTSYDGVSLTYDEIGNPLYYYNGAGYNFTWNNRTLVSATKGNVNMSFTYDSDGMRQTKTVGNETTKYYYYGTLLLAMENTSGETFVFIYDESGSPIGFQYRTTSYAVGAFDTYWYEKNLQGDITAVYSSNRTLLVSYTYDAWGNFTSYYYNGGYSTPAAKNPLRYRGYFYDDDLDLYYLASRYYDARVGRFISPEPNVYASEFDSGSGLLGYNVYVYCANNPVNFSDHTGECILTALIVGVVVGVVIGGVVGGTIAYNSAKSSGLEGSDLFWTTVSGVGKGALIGGVAGGLVGATGGVVATYGAASIAGTAMITSTATIMARATEVTALQVKKSMNDGDNGWQIANDCINSVFSNGGKIISPALTKAATTSATYVITDLTKHKVDPLHFDTFLHSPGGKALSYGLAAYAWVHTAYSIFCRDPIARANQRGYVLR